MPGLSRETAEISDHGVVEDRHGEAEDHVISFVTFRASVDNAPLLKGLPGDKCHCPHWGYVTKGEIGFVVDGVEETFKTGDAFYVSRPHTQTAIADSEIVMFSPAAELAETEAAMAKNMQAMMGTQ
ncbi:MAG: hypothetical protein WAT66_09090 [Actinomycetota bacterium]